MVTPGREVISSIAAGSVPNLYSPRRVRSYSTFVKRLIMSRLVALSSAVPCGGSVTGLGMRAGLRRNLRAGARRYPDYSYQSVADAKWVAGGFEPPRRELTHHPLS